MKLGLLLPLVALACCKSAVTPADQSVYGALVDAGCLAPAGDGPASVAAENSRPDRPAWLACLYDGGSVQACGVPCQ